MTEQPTSEIVINPEEIVRSRKLRDQPYVYEPEPDPAPAQEGDVVISMPLASATIILEGGDS